MSIAAPLLGPIIAAGAGPTGFPASDEALTYSITWPSGISLGEGKLSATRAGSQWTFDLKLEAAVPGFAVRDTYHSSADLKLCAGSFERITSHGSRKASETTTISGGTAVRQTANSGGRSEIPVGPCAHDALTFLFYARQELAQGRVPAAQQILFGSEYQIALQFSGLQTIQVGGAAVQADRVVCTVSSKQPQPYSFEMYFARDVARTPLLVRVPFAVGAISMELVR